MFGLTIGRAKADLVEGEEETKRAPRFPLSLIAALEVAVANASLTKGMRIVAWTRLLKVYGTLRADDLQRLRPRDVSMGEAGMTGKLMRTKTTGPGKKVKQLTVFVPFEAQISGNNWLQVGYDLWRSVVSDTSDFFLPRLTPDTEDFENKMATPMDVSSMGTFALTLLSAKAASSFMVHALAASGTEGPLLVPSDEKFLDEGLEGAWTGHSERSSLPSLAAAIGIPKSERDYLGRWSPSGSDEYVRTYRAVVRKAMAILTNIVKKGSAYLVLDEAEAFETAVAALVRKGLDPEAAKVLESSAKKKAKIILEALRLDLTVVPEFLPAPFLEPAAGRTEEERDEDKIEDKEMSESKFIVSVGRRRRGPTVDCLHIVGGCWRARALAFSSYELNTEDQPPASSYGVVCRQCWPSGGPDFLDDGTTDTEIDSELDLKESGTEESAD